MATKFEEMAIVLSQKEIATDIFDLTIQTKDIAAHAKAGQFISLYCNDGTKLLPRPISLCGIDREAGTLRLVYRVTGEKTGTKEFSQMKAGDEVRVLGPLGNGFELGEKKAFLIGGLICVIGQLLIDYTKLTPARILVSFVVIGVILGGLGLYQPLVEWAGAGATVPLTGFGNTLVQGTKEAIRQDGALGILTGPLSSASVGITTAMVCGLVVSFITKPKSK